ncbi:MAG: ABC transporter permease [Rhodomicrobium sp.]|nr:MAG: ABC transporter permease [Rhodomicrobium sp.]
MGTEPLLHWTDSNTGEKRRLVASGAWTANNATGLEKLIDAATAGNDAEDAVVIEMAAVTEFDTYGAWLLERLKRELTAHQNSNAMVDGFEISGLSSEDHLLFREVERVNKTKSAPLRRPFGVMGFFETTGKAIVELVHDMRAFANMFGALVVAFLSLLTRPSNFRFTTAVHQLDRVTFQAVPIILLITFLIGAIIAQQGFFHFRKFGADLYVVDMVGILVLREIGVLLVAIMVAGRSGSSFTAELGSMKMREEIDALRTMGFNPVQILILPRILILILAVPMLTFLGSMASLYGGGLIAVFYAGMSPELFMERLKEAISLTHFQVGMIKAPFMGAVIGIIACTEGLRTKGSAASLGEQTTKSVVKAIFMVIVLDGLFAIFFASVGM